MLKGMLSRYVQAKRHGWGVTESMWILASYRQIQNRMVWANMLAFISYDQVSDTTLCQHYFLPTLLHRSCGMARSQALPCASTLRANTTLCPALFVPTLLRCSSGMTRSQTTAHGTYARPHGPTHFETDVQCVTRHWHPCGAVCHWPSVQHTCITI